MPKQPAIYLLMLALTPLTVNAQFGNMSQEQLQQMLKQGLQMQQCFSQIDQATLQNLSARGRAMEAEISALCKAGDRTGAQNKAMTFARDMINDPTLQQMRKCGEGMAGMLPKILAQTSPDQTASDQKPQHICDNL